jgi:hypothetical protein
MHHRREFINFSLAVFAVLGPANDVKAFTVNSMAASRTAYRRSNNPRQATPERSEETGQKGGSQESSGKSKGLRRLAQLSLEDYKWRSSLFKTKEADRRVEESLARMMGDEASYVRPMDASDKARGPLVSFRLW